MLFSKMFQVRAILPFNGGDAWKSRSNVFYKNKKGKETQITKEKKKTQYGEGEREKETQITKKKK